MSAEQLPSPEKNNEFSNILFLVKKLAEEEKIETANPTRVGGLIHVMYENLSRDPKLSLNKLSLNQIEEAQSLLSGVNERVRKALASRMYWELKQIEHMLKTRSQIKNA